MVLIRKWTNGSDSQCNCVHRHWIVYFWIHSAEIARVLEIYPFDHLLDDGRPVHPGPSRRFTSFRASLTPLTVSWCLHEMKGTYTIDESEFLLEVFHQGAVVLLNMQSRAGLKAKV